MITACRSVSSSVAPGRRFGHREAAAMARHRLSTPASIARVNSARGNGSCLPSRLELEIGGDSTRSSQPSRQPNQPCQRLASSASGPIRACGLLSSNRFSAPRAAPRGARPARSGSRSGLRELRVRRHGAATTGGESRSALTYETLLLGLDHWSNQLVRPRGWTPSCPFPASRTSTSLVAKPSSTPRRRSSGSAASRTRLYNRIIERAGISKGAMYYYFADKDDLFRTVLDAALGSGWRTSATRFRPIDAASFWAACRSIYERSLRFMLADRQQRRALPEHHARRARLEGHAGAARAPAAHAGVDARARASTAQSIGAMRTDIPLDLLVRDRAVDDGRRRSLADGALGRDLNRHRRIDRKDDGRAVQARGRTGGEAMNEADRRTDDAAEHPPGRPAPSACATSYGFATQPADAACASSPIATATSSRSRCSAGPGSSISHPDDIEAVLVKHARIMLRDEYVVVLERALGKGLLTSDGDPWKRQRKLMSQAFVPKRIQVVRRRDGGGDGRGAAARGDDGAGGQPARGDLAHHDGGRRRRCSSARASAATTCATVREAMEVVNEFLANSPEAITKLPGWVPTPRNIRDEPRRRSRSTSSSTGSSRAAAPASRATTCSDAARRAGRRRARA